MGLSLKGDNFGELWSFLANLGHNHLYKGGALEQEAARTRQLTVLLAILAACLFCWSGGKTAELNPFSLIFHRVSGEGNKCQMSHCGHGFAMSQTPLLAPTLVLGSAMCKRYITGCVDTALP